MDDFRWPLPDELSKLLESCWHQQPDQRPNMAHVVDTLQTFLHSDKNTMITLNDEIAKIQETTANKTTKSSFIK